MLEETSFPIVFERCPVCKNPDTVARLAFKERIVDKGKGQEQFASAEKVAVPLTDPRTVALSVDVLVFHYDVCVGCGTRYCTKAEITTGNIKFEPQLGQPGRSGFPPMAR